MQTHSNRGGVALVIVLGFLVLLSGLAIAFFSSVTTELGASRTYSNNITTRQLADSAVNIVMGQVREGTARKSAVWGSQPGLIRVYRDGGGSPSANADAFFKLYSAKNMVVTDFAGFDPNKAPVAFDPTDNNQDVAKNWDQFPALFADLNAPVVVSDPAKADSQELPVFPIVDPRAYADVEGNIPTSANPSLVEGFRYSTDVNRAVATGDSDKWRLPMPVRWIYVLRDGTLTVPVSQDGSGVVDKWYSANTAKSDFRYPTKENPIVGRIAFWADDDTSKVNINTAGGRGTYTDNGYTENNYAGSFWDTPRFNHLFDLGRVDDTTGELKGSAPGGLASTQPFQKEFQRYPGHPATTSMGAVFARLLTSDQIYKLSPVLNYYDPNSPGTNNTGGSRGGTVRVDKNKAVELLPKQERLYASLDELLYADKPLRDGKRELNDKFIEGKGVITPDKLEKMKFFLTPHSRSPDLNLFGLPRITIWPVNQAGDEAEGRNVFDRAITYCSNVGGQKFIFTRSGNNGRGGAVSTTMDIGASLQKSGRWITRNKDLMEYLRALTSSNIPGFEGKFVTKYGAANRDMILGEIFDYIRIANLRDTTKDMDKYWFAPSGTVFPSRKQIPGWSPGKIGGFGRFSTIYEASVVFYCTGVSTDGGNTWTQDEITDFAQRKSINRRRVSAFLVFSTFNPMQGYAPITAPWRRPGNDTTAYFMPKPSSNADPNKKYGPPGTSQRLIDEEKMIIKLTDVSGFKLDGQELAFPEGAINKFNVTSGQTWGGRNFGGYEGFFHGLQGHDGKPPNESQRYQFHSTGEVSIPVDSLSDDPNPTVKFDGGKVTVNIYAGFITNTDASQNGDPIQKIELEFPEADVPIPARRYWRTTGGFVKEGLSAGSQIVAAASASPKSAQHLHWVSDDDVGRIEWTRQHSSEPDQNSQVNAAQRWRQIIQPGDVVRSLVYGARVAGKSSQPNGDLRLLVLSENVDATKFNKHPDYDNSELRFAQGLRMADGQVYITPATVVDLDAPLDQTLDARTRSSTEKTAYGRHVVGLNLNSNSKAMMLPSSQDGTTRYVDGIIRNDNPSRKFLGDFDTGLGVFPDGPYAGKQDEGNVIFKYFDYTRQKWIFPTPYKGNHEYEEPGDIFFSPNRQMPSAVLFGSLLSRPRENRPWETLAFSPNTGGAEHPGNFVAPMDHLLLDLFTMPIVEPYLMSEPLSTAGRVSLNYQIAPFGYIQRSTGLRAALHPLRVSAVKNELATNASYKTGTMLTDTTINPRKLIDRDETIAAFDAYFKQYSTNQNKGFFKSASQICERFLYPQGESFNGSLYDPVTSPLGESTIRDFWNNHRLTGDNVREKPYADLYPRVTTKSNTYTVHMRVQTIRQVGLGGDYSKWKEGRDVVVGEYRGSTTIERFIDASDPKVVDRVKTLSSNPQNQTLEDLYRFRVIATKKFSP